MRKRLLPLALALAVCLGLLPTAATAAQNSGYNLTPAQAELYLDKLLTTRDEHLNLMIGDSQSGFDELLNYGRTGLLMAKLIDLDHDGVPVLLLVYFTDISGFGYDEEDGTCWYSSAQIQCELWKVNGNKLEKRMSKELYDSADWGDCGIYLYRGAKEDGIVARNTSGITWGPRHEVSISRGSRMDELTYMEYDEYFEASGDTSVWKWNDTELSKSQAKQYYDEYVGKSEALVEMNSFLSDLPSAAEVEQDIQDTVSTLCQSLVSGWYLSKMPYLGDISNFYLFPEQAAEYAKALREFTIGMAYVDAVLFPKGNGKIGLAMGLVPYDWWGGTGSTNRSIFEVYGGPGDRYGSISENYVEVNGQGGTFVYPFSNGLKEWEECIWTFGGHEYRDNYGGNIIDTAVAEARLKDLEGTSLYIWDGGGNHPAEVAIAALEVYAASAPAIAYPSAQTVTVDGAPVEFQMYALQDASGNPTNYVKVRDVAGILNGTAAQFTVGYYNGAVHLVKGWAYTPNGSEGKTPFSGNQIYTKSAAQTDVDGAWLDLDAITLTDAAGGGYTYYKLRDLAQALGFNVGWNGEKGVYIETDKPYDPSN